MSPEQLRQGAVDRRTDVYAAGIVLWELLTSERLFTAESEGGIVTAVLEHRIAAPSTRVSTVSGALDAVVMQALAFEPSARFATARQMALALERCGGLASATGVGEWVDGLAHETLGTRSRIIADIERGREIGPEPEAPVGAMAEQKVLDRPGDGVTQVTSTTERTPAGSRSRRWRAVSAAFVAGVAATAAVLLGVGSVVLGVGSGERGSPGTAGSEVATSTASSAPNLLSSSFVVESPSSTAVTAPSVVEKPATSAPRAAPRVRPGAGAGQAKPCAVKSFVDDAGVKHFFRDCSR
jgi:serine/threonine-protein kinase